MNFRQYTVAAAALLSFAGAASADVISLTPVEEDYQQSIQSPCIFSNASCQNDGFEATALPGSGATSSYDVLSPEYSGATIIGIIGAGNPLLIGVDINEANAPQTLTTFEMLVNGVVVDTFSGTFGNVPASSNGNGFADYLLSGFSAFSSTDTIQFHFVFNDANDGTENLFLIGGTPVTPPVPEPETYALMLAGLGVVGFMARRRKQQV